MDWKSQIYFYRRFWNPSGFSVSLYLISIKASLSAQTTHKKENHDGMTSFEGLGNGNFEFKFLKKNLFHIICDWVTKNPFLNPRCLSMKSKF